MGEREKKGKDNRSDGKEKKNTLKRFPEKLRLIHMQIRSRASGFGHVAKIIFIRAKSKQDSCAEMVLASFVFLLV